MAFASQLAQRVRDVLSGRPGITGQRCLTVLRYIWAAPCTVAGLCLAAPVLLFSGRSRVVNGVIEIAVAPRVEASALERLLPFNAITFGHVVIGTTAEQLRRLRAHEHEHVRQYEKWGALFFVAYPAASLWELLKGGRPYVDNWFEIEARACECPGARGAEPIMAGTKGNPS